MTVLVSRNEFSLSQVHSAALGLSLALGLAGGAATLAVVRAFVPLVGVSRVVAVLFIFTMPMVVYKAMWGGLFLGLTRIASLNAFNLLDSVLVTLASVLALLVFRAGLDGVLLALVVQASLMVVLGLAFVARERGLSWQFSLACLAELLRQGSKLHFAAALGQLFLKADALILPRLVPAADIGQYAVARGLAERILMVLSPVSQVMFPRIASAQADQGRQYALASFRAIGALGLGAGIGFVLGAPFVVPLMYGSLFGKAVGLTQILAPAFALLGLMVPVNLWFVGSLKRPELNAVVNSIALGCLIIVGWMFTALAGSRGMAWATLLSFGVTLGCGVWLANRHGFGFRRPLPGWQEVVQLWRDVRPRSPH